MKVSNHKLVYNSFSGLIPTTYLYPANFISISKPIDLSYFTHPLTPSAGIVPPIEVSS